MIRALHELQHSIFAVLFLGLWAANAFFIQNALLGAALAVFFFVWFGSLIAHGLAGQERGMGSWWIGMWMLLSGIMIVGSAAYYLAFYTPEVAYVLLLLSVPVAMWIGKRKDPLGWLKKAHDLVREGKHVPPKSVWIGCSIALLALVVSVQQVLTHATELAVRSPWLVIPPSFFVSLGIALLLLVSHLYRGRERALSIALTAATLGCVLTVAILVFTIGYGFDSFIHKATEAHIAEFGTITPKPFYYIGQYALVLFLHHAFTIPVDVADTWLVPILAALLLPLAWLSAAAHIHKEHRAATFSLVGLFLIPLGSFIVTTPQGLANLWTFLLVLAAVPYLLASERPRVFALGVPALATLSIHPIAGLPALIFLSLVACDPEQTNARWQKVARALFWLIAILGCAVLPASFVANALRTSGSAGLDLSAFTPSAIFSALHLELFFENRFNAILDFAYLWGFNAIAAVILLSLAAAWMHRKHTGKLLRVYLVMAAILLANYLILATAVDFSFLIDYERGDYASRLIPLAVFVLSPLWILGLGSIARQTHSAPLAVRAGLVVLATGLCLSAVYMTYPRNDSYETSHGFNVGRSDLNAAYAIEQDADAQPYLVLANQSVSAAALSQQGFAHYFGDLFFYPIPTGGPLYDIFLRMNEKPSRELALEAASLGNNSACTADGPCGFGDVEIVYYVVNEYWWQSDRLIESGKQTSDRWFAIDDGAIHVFVYELSP